MLFTHWRECILPSLCGELTHVTPITTNRNYVHKFPFCVWTEWTCHYLLFRLDCKQCLSKAEVVIFSNLMKNSVAHLLSTVRAIHALRIIWLPKSMPATEHKHKHSLIVLMRLQLQMPQCCCLAKEQNKHQIHLEKKEKKNPLSLHVSGLQFNQDFRTMVCQIPLIFFFSNA